MDKDRVAGAAEQVKGSVKEGIGKITAMRRPRPRVRREPTGKAQSAAGGVKDSIHETVEK